MDYRLLDLWELWDASRVRALAADKEWIAAAKIQPRDEARVAVLREQRSALLDIERELWRSIDRSRHPYVSPWSLRYPFGRRR